MSTIPRGGATCAVLALALLAGANAVPAKGVPAPPPPAASAAAPAITTPQPQYVRIQVSAKRSIYVEFRGNEMRMASTAAALETAKAVRAPQPKTAPGASRFISVAFPEAGLPVPGDQLPPGFAEARARFTYEYYPDTEDTERRPSYVDAQIGLSPTDRKHGLWVYWVSEFVQPKQAPVSAPAISLPRLASLSLRVSTKGAEQRKVGIAVAAKSGEAELSDVTRNGRGVSARLRVLDRNKKVVASDKGALSKFGFG